MSAFGGKADIDVRTLNVCFWYLSDQDVEVATFGGIQKCQHTGAVTQATAGYGVSPSM
jgi:hypothetical protein